MAGVVWWAPLCVAALLVVPSSQQYSNTPCLDAVRNQDPPRPGQRQHDCDEAGEYKPQQCHGSRCFCVDPLGQQMTQFETVGRHEAHTVSCACARQKTERGGRHGGPPTTCDRFGNFAPRQCIGSQCYCVDPLTGDRLGGIASVHVSQIDQLQCEPQHRRRLGVPDEGQPGRGRRLGGGGGRLGGAGRQLLGGRTPCWDELRTHEERTQPLLGAEKPNCDRTGKYHPKQCRGSECFCVDPYNNPVAQYRRSRGEAVDMGCLCSRREWELQQGGLLGLSVICDELGNFAPHQCVGSQCHCVEPLSGARLPGLESHIGELAQLDCAGHRRQLLGADRPCEDQRRSAPYGQPQPECDRAGKFAPVQCSGDLCRCVAPNGEEIEGYQHPVGHRASMSCVCARRSWELSKEGLDGLGHPVVCDKFGGFHLHQCEGSTCYCVDPATGQPEAGGASVHVAKLASLQCGGGSGGGGDQRPLLGSRQPALGSSQPCWQHRRRLQQQQAASPHPLLGLELPDCDRAGHYSPRQCRGSECTCVDRDGSSLPEYRGGRQHQHRMHCVCARMQHEVTSLGLVGVSHDCDQLGNFELRQCRGSQCYCVDPHTGSQVSDDVVHVSQVDDLDCSEIDDEPEDDSGRPLLGSGRHRLGEDGSGQRVRPGQGGSGTRQNLRGSRRRLGEDGAGIQRPRPGQDGSGTRRFRPGQDGSGTRQVFPGHGGAGTQQIFPGHGGAGTQQVFPGHGGAGTRDPQFRY